MVTDRDDLILEKARRSPNGASSIDIARVSLGWRAKKHNLASLDLIGLSIAARLVGAGHLRATRSNRFTATRKDAA